MPSAARSISYWRSRISTNSVASWCFMEWTSAADTALQKDSFPAQWCCLVDPKYTEPVRPPIEKGLPALHLRVCKLIKLEMPGSSGTEASSIPLRDVDKSSCHAILAQGILWAHPNGHAWPGNDCHGESQSQWKGLGWASSWSHPIHI